MYAPNPAAYGHSHAPAAAYAAMDRAARVLAAGPHGLILILYEELELAIAVARRAALRGDRTGLMAQQDRALAVLAALQEGLDPDSGGAVSTALAQVYAQVSAEVQSGDVALLARAGGTVREIAGAWRAIG